MARRVFTDAKQRDWVVVRGSNQQDDGYTSRARWLLSLKKGTAAAYPELGSEYHTLTKQVANLPELLVKFTQQALQPMVDDKSLTQVSCTVDNSVGEAWNLTVTLHIGSTTYSFPHGVVVGGR